MLVVCKACPHMHTHTHIADTKAFPPCGIQQIIYCTRMSKYILLYSIYCKNTHTQIHMNVHTHLCASTSTQKAQDALLFLIHHCLVLNLCWMSNNKPYVLLFPSQKPAIHPRVHSSPKFLTHTSGKLSASKQDHYTTPSMQFFTLAKYINF